MSDSLPGFADTVVIGAGTAGAAIAGVLAASSDQSLLLLEAGPDYGSFEDGRWPADLTDARAIPTSHDWGYSSGGQYGRRVLKFDRARVMGGCSSHNGCAAIWGSRLDYDHWAELGNPGWSTEDLLALFRAGSERLRVRIPPRHEITPYQLVWLEAAPRAGIPLVADLNNLDQNLGMAPSPANVADGIRWNAAFAYLDPVRDRNHLTIAGGVLADRLLIRGARVEAVRVIRNGQEATIKTGRVVLAAGTYGSPAILIRSGVGPELEVRALGVGPVLDVPGVGRNLHDHPMVGLVYAGTPELEAAMAEFANPPLDARGTDHRQSAILAMRRWLRFAHLSGGRASGGPAGGMGLVASGGLHDAALTRRAEAHEPRPGRRPPAQPWLPERPGPRRRARAGRRN
jgi:choline dehydrogenase